MTKYSESQRCVERNYRLVPLSDVDKVIGIPQVEFSERDTMEGAKAELLSGKGYLFLTVILFNARTSMHGLNDPSFFLTKKNPAPTGEEEGLTCPAARES